ncbi:HNH endonuclease [Plesiomonas shigelloides]|uniref:HNH endonuclease n=1 Tax=Plesiomonas shigelloides TaxID=703 RepID=UPI003139ED7E
MIEDEACFKQYLTALRNPRLKESTADSYISYLHRICSHLNTRITRAQFHNIDEVKNVVFGLTATKMHSESVRNCQSALRAYLQFNRATSTSNKDVIEQQGYLEGNIISVEVNKYERDPRARIECIKHHGTVCKVCGFDYSMVYGSIGKGFIHIHHLTPLSVIKESYIINPKEDLVPVCANCHAMLHRRNPPLSIKELKSMISSSNDDT